MRSFSAKRKFKAIVRKQMFLHKLQGAIAESTADGTLESAVTEQVASAIAAEHPDLDPDPAEYISGVHGAISEHGLEVISVVSVRQTFNEDSNNQACADTGRRLVPTDTWVNPSLGVFISGIAAEAHQSCGLEAFQMDEYDFTPEQIARVTTHGNAAQNANFEALTTAAECKAAALSQGIDGITQYVKAKYVDKVFCLGGTGSLGGAEPSPAPETADFESTLRVLVRRGENLKKMDYFPFTSDPYVVMKCGEGSHEKHTKVISNNVNPVWDEELAFNNVAGDARITLACWDQDLGVSDDPMGVWNADKTVAELCPERGVGVEIAAVLTEVSHGTIHMTLTWG
jgi:hypothetical protein